jgi:tetratricopeptide (TPR) repeat protein
MSGYVLAETPLQCRLAETLLDNDLDDEALRILKKELAKDKPEECVIQALQRIAAAKEQEYTDKLLLAEALTTAGAYDEAIEVLNAVAAGEGVTEDVAERIRQVVEARTEDAYAHVRALADAALYEQALTALQSAVEKDPKHTIPPDLLYLQGGGLEDWREIKHYLVTYGLPVAEAFLVVFLAGFFILRIWGWSFAKPLLNINSFKDNSVGQKCGDEMSALVRSSFFGFSAAKGSSITRISGNVEGVTLPATVQQSLPGGLNATFVQALFSLLEKLLPPRSYSVEGSLLSSERKGAGLAIRVERKGRDVDSITLWSADFCLDSRGESMWPGTEAEGQESKGKFEALAEYAAIWLFFRFTDGYGLRSNLRRKTRRKSVQQRLGTTSWRAYALFRAGLSAERQKCSDDAKALYVAAMRADPGLSIAKINMAQLIWREAIKETPAKNKKLIQMAQELLEECMQAGSQRKKYRRYPHEPSHYSAKYLLASMEYDENNAKRALELAEELNGDIEQRLSELKWLNWLRWKQDDRLQAHLRILHLLVKAMLGGLYIADGGLSDGAKIILSVSDLGKALPRHQYNLACSYSLWAAAETDPDKQQELLDKSIGYLTRSVWINPEFSERAQLPDRALEFVEQAREDQFKEAIGAIPVPPQMPVAQGLQKLWSIGLQYEQQLKGEGIESESQLLLGTRTLPEREKLAKKIGIGVAQVTEWAHSVELASVPGIELEDVNLLMLAGVRDLSALQAEGVPALHDKLSDWAKTKKQSRVPEQSTLKFWIDNAKQMQPIVQQ